MREYLLVGMGQNAGVVDIESGWAVTFKVESHNHPSYIEPYQEAATGVGGIVAFKKKSCCTTATATITTTLSAPL